MSGVLCEECQGYFQTSAHQCGAKLQEELNQQILDKHRYLDLLDATAKERDAALKEVEKLNLELMERDTRPDFERGEYAGQDATIRHIGLLTEEANSQLAKAVRGCPTFKSRAEVFRQIANYLEVATFKLGVEYNPEAANACRVELSLLQARAARYAAPEVE